jgi:hypothetical protein
VTPAHSMTVRRWDNPRTYLVECCCGWVAPWAQSARIRAEMEWHDHVAATAPPDPVDAPDARLTGWWMPGA